MSVFQQIQCLVTFPILNLPEDRTSTIIILLYAKSSNTWIATVVQVEQYVCICETSDALHIFMGLGCSMVFRRHQSTVYNQRMSIQSRCQVIQYCRGRGLMTVTNFWVHFGRQCGC